MPDATDLYAVLGVPRAATLDEIKRAYRKLARRYHPDVNPGKPDAEAKFKEATAAYEVLGDPERRKAYDEFGADALAQGFDPERARAHREWADARARAGRPFESERMEVDLRDLFGDLWNGGARERGPRPGADVLAVAELEFAEALRGTLRQVRVSAPRACARCSGSGAAPGSRAERCDACAGTGRRRAVEGPLGIFIACGACAGTGKRTTPCPDCRGAGVREAAQTVGVRIPPGAEDGERLRVAGAGAAGPEGGPTGDLVVEIRVRPHPRFRREGLDLHLRLPVTLAEAWDGAEVPLPTPHGTARLRVPRRSQSGDRLRLHGQGVERQGRRGDLIVELALRLPDREDPALDELVRRTAAAYTRPVREGIAL